MTVEEYDAMNKIQQTLAETYFALKEKGEISEEFMAYLRDMNNVWIEHIKAICLLKEN